MRVHIEKTYELYIRVDFFQADSRSNFRAAGIRISIATGPSAATVQKPAEKVEIGKRTAVENSARVYPLPNVEPIRQKRTFCKFCFERWAFSLNYCGIYRLSSS